jgi:hypothetical protein
MAIVRAENFAGKVIESGIKKNTTKGDAAGLYSGKQIKSVVLV